MTAEAAPHHFALTDAELAGYDPVFKVNPPLRTAGDVAAVRAGLADGTVDAIATDHAPHAPEAKERPLRPGAAGHARAGDRRCALALAELGLPGLARVLALLSWRPAAIAGLDADQGGDQGGRWPRGCRPTSA